LDTTLVEWTGRKHRLSGFMDQDLVHTMYMGNITETLHSDIEVRLICL